MAESSSERKILVAVDGSPNADNAFNWVLDNVVVSGDTIVCVHCAEYHITPGAPGFSDPVNVSNAIRDEHEKVANLIAKYAQVLKQKGIKGKSVKMENKKPGEAIVKAANEEHASMIVTGTRGLGVIRRTIMGSVSDYIVHHAHCPVIIYRE